MDRKKINLLILEDNPDDAQLMVKELEKEQYELNWKRVETKRDFEKGLSENPDIIFVDYAVPSFNGLDALMVTKKIKPDIPVIMVSGKIGEEVAVDCIKAGATDYVLKNRLFRLEVVTRRAIKETEILKEQQRIEHHLKKSRELYTDLSDNANDLIHRVTADGRFEYVNKTWMRTLGYNKEDIPELRLWSIIHPDSLEHCREVFVKVMKSETVSNIEAVFLTKNGKEIYVEGNANCYYKNGKPVSTRGIFRDITKRKQAEKTLQNSEKKYRTLVESLEEGIGIVNKNEDFIFVNKTAADIFGCSKEELIGKNLKDFTREEEFKKILKQTLARRSGKTNRYEFSLNRKDRIIRILSVTATPMYDEDDKYQGSFGIFHDITENKTAGKALERRTAHLTALSKAGQQITSILELDALLNKIVNTVSEAFKFGYATIFLIDTSTDELVFKAGSGYDIEKIKHIRFKLNDRSICGWVGSNAKASIIPDVSENKHYLSLEIPKDINSELTVPIKVKGKIIGVLDVQNKKLNAFEKADIFTLQTFANQVGVAIDNARLFEKTHQQALDINLLYETGRLLALSLDSSKILDRIAKRCTEVMKADLSLVRLIEKDLLVVRSSYFRNPAEKKEVEKLLAANPLHIGEGIAGKVAENGEPAIHKGEDTKNLTLPDYARYLREKEWIVVPMRVGAKINGVLTLIRKSEKGVFLERDIVLVQGIADQAAVAIKNARLYEQAQIEVEERRNIEEKLRENEEKFRSITTTAQDAIILMDNDGCISYWNKAAEQIFKYKKSEVIGKPVHSIVAPQKYHKGFVDGFKGFKETGMGAFSGKTIEITGLTKDGVEFPIELSISAIKLKGKWNAVAIIRNISERKHSENALKDSEERYRTLFEKALDGILIADVETRNFKYCNRAVCKMLGYSKDELIKMSVNDIHPEDEIEHMISEFEAQVIKEKTLASDIPCLRKDGSIIYVDINANIAVINGKKCIIGFFRDTMERKQAEQALKESEENYKILVDHSPLGILKIDTNGNIEVINSALLKILGSPSEQDTKKINMITFPLLVKSGISKIIKECIKKGKSINGEFPYISKWGREVTVNIYLTPILDPKGKVSGVLGMVEDISERKNVQQVQEVIYNIANAVITTKDIKDLFHSIRKHLSKVIDTSNFYVALYDKEKDMILLPYEIDEKEKFSSFPAGKTFTAYVLKTGKPLLADEEKGRKLVASGKVEMIGIPAKIWLGVPLKIGKEVIGVVVVQSYSDSSLYTKKDMEILEFVSEQIALAIERKKAENAIRESEMRSGMILRTIPSGFFTIDVNRIITSWNKGAEEITGLRSTDVVGEHCLDILDCEECRKHCSLFDEKIDKPIIGKECTLNLVGKKITISKNADILKDLKGNVIGALESFDDVSDRKRTEEELIKKNEELSKFNLFAVDRELKMVELKKKVNELLIKLKKKPKYKIIK